MKSQPQPLTFQTIILQEGNNTGIPVPDEVVEQLGSGKRPLVRVTLKEYTYRSAIARMGDNFMISLSKAHRQAAEVQGGDEVAVTVVLDLEPRTVELPEDLETALKEAGALAAFKGSAPSKKKEFVRQVESAKAQATRERRISKIVDSLKQK